MSEFVRLVIVHAAVSAFQILFYFGSEIFQHNFHNVLCKADEKIPFLPATVLVYSLWFPLIVLFPMGLYYADPIWYGVYVSAFIFEIVLSVVCYLVYPTTFTRPVPPDTLFGRLMAVVYKGSYRGVNCAPSLHCSSCYLVIFACLLCGALPPAAAVVSGVISAGIVISTMTTKQHALVDALSALPVAVLCLWLGKLFPAMILAVWIGG